MKSKRVKSIATPKVSIIATNSPQIKQI